MAQAPNVSDLNGYPSTMLTSSRVFFKALPVEF
jgi:hypothetical protein